MIAYESPQYANPAAFDQESRRVYEICNGCRRCFNLCPSFDVLFRGIDEKDGEVSAVDASRLERVVDLCYYCKLCYNHCPYCPPHDYDLDFPRLMLWGKHLKAKEHPPSWRDRWLAQVERAGRLGGLLAPLLNFALRRSTVRWLLEKGAGIHRRRLFPKFHRESFSSWFRRRTPKAASATPSRRRVAFFYTCYVNHHDPALGKAAIEVLQKNGIEAVCPDQTCCGMPYYDIGDLDTVRRKARSNLGSLGPLVEEGYAVVAPMPTCSLMLKKEYPELVPTDPARRVAARTFDLGEYLMALEGEGVLAKDFVFNPGKIAYQVPCHLRDQNIGLKSRDLLKLIPGASVEVVEKCSGHNGTFGVKREYYDLSLNVGKKAFGAVSDAGPDLIATDCPLSGLALTQSTRIPALHPVQILHRAYGLERKEAVE